MAQQSSQLTNQASGTAAKNGGARGADPGLEDLKRGVAKDAEEFEGGLKDLASGVADDAKLAVEGRITSQKSRVVESLDGVAMALRRVSTTGNEADGTVIAPGLVPYFEEAASRAERASAYFENKSVADVARDVEGFARREPALFLGGAFALGLLGGRFLKASQPAGSAHAGHSAGASETQGVRPQPWGPYPPMDGRRARDLDGNKSASGWSPGGQRSGGQSPGSQSPGSQSPGSQSPGSQSPGSQSQSVRASNPAQYPASVRDTAQGMPRSSAPPPPGTPRGTFEDKRPGGVRSSNPDPTQDRSSQDGARVTGPMDAASADPRAVGKSSGGTDGS